MTKDLFLIVLGSVWEYQNQSASRLMSGEGYCTDHPFEVKNISLIWQDWKMGRPLTCCKISTVNALSFPAYHEMREVLLPFLHRKDLEGTICLESDWESPRKYLFTDLDGRTLGLPPPVTVFPKIEAEWTGSFFNTGWLCPTMMPMAKPAGM